MADSNTGPKDHGGLSPSSLTLFLTCQRKYFHRKIAKTPIDTDVEDDVEALQVGKAFHKCLEDTKHDLEGVTGKWVRDTVLGFGGLTEEFHYPLIFAMLSKYKEMHRKAGLKVIACETTVETAAFFGIVDVVLLDAGGSWWLGDMKTAGSYTPSLIPSLPRHPQLNLYAAHYHEIAKAMGLSPDNYRGCRYRMTTKSKLNRKDGETTEAFIARLAKAVKSIDFILPKEVMNPVEIVAVHKQAKEYIEATKGFLDPTYYSPNYGNCLQYYRSCEYWSRCHGARNTDMMSLESISSE